MVGQGKLAINTDFIAVVSLKRNDGKIKVYLNVNDQGPFEVALHPDIAVLADEFFKAHYTGGKLYKALLIAGACVVYHDNVEDV